MLTFWDVPASFSLRRSRAAFMQLLSSCLRQVTSRPYVGYSPHLLSSDNEQNWLTMLALLSFLDSRPNVALLWLNHDRSRATGSRMDRTTRSCGNEDAGISSTRRLGAPGWRMYFGIASRKVRCGQSLYPVLVRSE